MELAREEQVVRRAERLLAEVREGEAGHAAIGRGNLDLPGANPEPPRSRRRVTGQPTPGGVERRLRLRIGRRVVDGSAGKLLQAEIGARLELEHVEPPLHLGDEGQEQRTVQTVLVEILRIDVGRGDHDHALVPERREQAAEDHRISDVIDRELIEAENPGLGCQSLGHRCDRICALRFAVLGELPPLMDAAMGVGHEIVEMRPPLPLRRHFREEHVHEHRLAAPDSAPDVEAARRLRCLRLGPEEPAQGARFAREPRLVDRFGEGSELPDGGGLRRIGLDLAGLHHGKVAGLQLRHARLAIGRPRGV